MKTLIVLAIGFYLGVSYSNGDMERWLDGAESSVNKGAEEIARATEPSTEEQIERRYRELEREVERLLKEQAQ